MDNVMSRIHLKSLARKQLRHRYWPALLVSMMVIFFVGTIPTSGRIPFTLVGFVETLLPFRPGLLLLIVTLLVSIVVQVFIAGPIAVGNYRYFIKETESEGQIKDLFFPFRTKLYWNIVFIMFLYLLIILGMIGIPIVIQLLFFDFRSYLSLIITLPLLLLGVIWSYRYRFLPYVIAQYPNVHYRRIMDMSKTLTEDGVGIKLFLLDLSFIGWYLIGGLLFGLGFFLVRPYHEGTLAQAYRYQTGVNSSFQQGMKYEVGLKLERGELPEDEESESKNEELKVETEEQEMKIEDMKEEIGEEKVKIGGLKVEAEEMKGGASL